MTDTLNIRIKDADLFFEDGLDKSVAEIELSDYSDLSIDIQVRFSDKKAISQGAAELDELIVVILKPNAFVSRTTGQVLGKASMQMETLI